MQTHLKNKVAMTQTETNGATKAKCLIL